MGAPLHVVACGLCSSLGLDRRSTQVELAAGADLFEETEVLDSRGQPIRASRLELLPASASRTERMAGLAALAIEEPLGVARALGLESLPIMLALPETDGGGAWRVEPIWAALFERASSIGVGLVPITHVQAIRDGTRRSGAAGLFELLEIADGLLESGIDPLVIGAIDSRCDPTSLIELARARRLLDGGVEGYLPGEGAGFVIFTRRAALLPPRTRPFTIIAHGHGVEPRPFNQRGVSQAQGLTRLFRGLRVGPPGVARVDLALSCQWDAGYWGRELVHAYLRNAELFPEPLRVDLIAEQLGNPGAAGPLLQLGRAFEYAAGVTRETEQAVRVLIYACAETGPLGACVVEAGPASALIELAIVAAPAQPERVRFNADRLADHLELIGSLLVQRSDDIVGASYPWPELEVLEQRIHARVRAANERARRLGPDLLDLLEHQDPDVVRACAYLLIGSEAPDYHYCALACMEAKAIDEGDEAELLLWRSGLAHARYGRDASVFVALLDSPSEAIALTSLAMLDELGHRPPNLLLALLDRPGRPASVHARALEMLTHSGAPQALARVDAAWRAAPEDPLATELLLTLGRHDVLDQLRLAYELGRELPAALYEVWALAASPRDAEVFVRLAERDTLEPAHLWALSSHGSLSAVPALIAALERPALAMDAAIGLERILGARSIGSVWTPDDDAEDPTREGESRLLPMLDAERWREFWAANHSRFSPAVRYRLGQPLDARTRVNELEDPNALPRMREQAVRELAASRGTPLYFGFNWPIAAQRLGIARLRAWLEAR